MAWFDKEENSSAHLMEVLSLDAKNVKEVSMYAIIK